jgi:RimJ/RimL family protein N-acetyltransferase
MLLELDPAEFSKLAVLRGEGGAADALLPLAVVHGVQAGRVFVDDRQRPDAAFIVNRFGFCLRLGRDIEGFDADLLQALGPDGELADKYLLWYAPPPAWECVFSSLAPGSVRRRERIRFEFDPATATYLAAQDACPPGFQLRPLTSSLLPQTQSLKLDIESRFWASADQFLANGVGVALLHGEEIVSVCYSACVVDKHAEVDVATSEAYRGRGLARLAAREYVRACLRKGLTPAWDAFIENPGSVRLAENLGFRPLRRYDFYTFATPLPSP